MALNPIMEKPIIAVTGSAGKTMVKTMIAAILREKWVVFESKDYYNITDKTKVHKDQISFIHRAAVLEYGMAFPGVITEHCRLIRPNIGVITNVGLAHVGNFEGKLEQVADAKSELIYGMHPSGILIIDADDQNSKLLHTNAFTGKIFTVGIREKADYQARELELSENGITFLLTLQGREYSFFVPIVGKHNVYNAMFAIAVADQLGFLSTEIQTGLKNLKKPNHRLAIHKLKDGITVIDDTVHAHPAAMKAALDVLENIGQGTKIAVLGSMWGLGVRTNEDHEDIGRYVASKNIEFLYTYGHVSALISKKAVDTGFSGNNVKHFTDKEVLHRELLELIEPGSTILVKGASRLNMYETVSYLCDSYRID